MEHDTYGVAGDRLLGSSSVSSEYNCCLRVRTDIPGLQPEDPLHIYIFPAVVRYKMRC